MQIVEKLKNRASNPKAPAVTIAFLGDSVTQGCFELAATGQAGEFANCYDRAAVYHTHVAEILAMLYPNVPLNILNAGVAGTGAPFGLAHLEQNVLSHKPDLTVVCFGLNDCGSGDEKLGQYIDALDQIFTKLQQAGSEVLFMTPNLMATRVSPFEQNPHFRAIAEKVACWQNAGVLDRYLQAARDLCARRGIAVCDCYEKWQVLAAAGVDTTELLSNKINHPTRPMHWLFAMALVETMLR